MPLNVFTPGPGHHTARDRYAVFLAGPIQGGPNWQSQAIELLGGQDCDVFNPRSPDGQVPAYEVQVSWERAHLDRAGRKGVVLFWLANPLRLSWRDRIRVFSTGMPTRPYAQTSRLELGWELARKVLGDPSHGAKGDVVVGMEPGFPNERFIRRLVEREIGARKIQSTLQDTVREATRALFRQEHPDPEEAYR